MQGVAAGVEHECVLHRLRCRTILDIGANGGQFALVARQCFPEARILSFEPLPRPADRYRKIFADDMQAALYQTAIGSERTRAVMHIAKRDDSSSLLPITAAQEAIFQGTGETGTTIVEVAPLPDYVSAGEIATPALLKIDVQGFELSVLRGCEALFERLAYIYVECSYVECYTGQALADEVIAWLGERSFRLTGIHNTVYDRAGRPIQSDLFFSSQGVCQPDVAPAPVRGLV